MINKEMNRLFQALNIGGVQLSVRKRWLMVKKNHPSRTDLIQEFEEELSALLEISVTWKDMMEDLRESNGKLSDSLIKNYTLEREIESLKSRIATLEKSNRELFEQL